MGAEMKEGTMKLVRRRGIWVGAGLLALLPLLTACQVDFELTLNADGSGVAVTRFTTDDEALFHEALRSAQELAQEAQEKGQRVVVTTERRGSEYVVRIEQRFRTIEELNSEEDPYGLEPVFALERRGGGQYRLWIRNLTPVLPTRLTIETPGPILTTSPGVLFEGRRATWAGMTYSGNFFVDYTASPGMGPGKLLLLAIVGVLMGGLGLGLAARKLKRQRWA